MNRDGIRIGTAEIYGVLDKLSFVSDSLIVCIEKKDGSFYMPLFVKMVDGEELTDSKKQWINAALRSTCSPRHVPDGIFAVPDIPYTISGKKLEIPVKRILMGWSPEKSASLDSMRNPGSLMAFQHYAIVHS